MTRLESVRQAVEAKGYTLISAEGYQNQDSIIKVQCNKGHITEVKFADFKKPSFTCPQCDASIKFNNPVNVPAKNGYRVVAFDQATEHFGVSIFDDGQLVFFNLYVFNGSLNKRLVEIKQFIENIVIAKWKPDFIICEDIQYQYGAVLTYKVLAMLLGVIETMLTEHNINYQVVSPNVWRKFAGTCGKSRTEEKQLSVYTVKEKYGVRVNDDVAEAILIGRYGVQAGKALQPVEVAFGRSK